MPRQNFTSINIVLDRSGSMEAVKADTIGGFNRFLEDQKQTPGDAVLTLAQFDDKYDVVHDAVPITQVPALTAATYIPRGYTALLDAIGRTINATGARLSAMREEDRPSQVIFVIMTDGAENASKEFTKAGIFDMIKRQRETYSWEFVFLGADQDAISVAGGLGMNVSNARAYAGTSKGTADAFALVSRGMSSYRGVGAAQVSNFFDPDKN